MSFIYFNSQVYISPPKKDIKIAQKESLHFRLDLPFIVLFFFVDFSLSLSLSPVRHREYTILVLYLLPTPEMLLVLHT
ncbi:MAG: hypothetical protein ACI8RD_004347 [Bacillariaceae sp.]|jgi:hypothetical protein